MKKIRHVGLRPERTKTNVLESAFARMWSLENATNRLGLAKHGVQGILKCLLVSDELARDVSFLSDSAVMSQRDATVVATVVQWFGSQVGQSFLEQVLRTPAGRKFLWDRFRVVVDVTKPSSLTGARKGVRASSG